MRARGFSLIELLVAMAISLIAVAAGVLLVIGSQRWFQTGTDDRAMQETARVALDELTSNLRMAGYGLEPTFAFDTGLLAATVQDRLPAGDQARFGGYNSAVRDRADGPDELVFYARDPDFERDVSAVGANTLTVDAPASGAATTFQSGQILQVMCYGSADHWLWAYVTVSSVDSTNAAHPVVTLRPATGLQYDFPLQNALLTGDPCFTAGAASVRAFKVDRYRYYIAAVDGAGLVQNWETPGTRPYLMLDQGLSQGGQPISIAIAPDVEDLQVAYVFPLAAGNQVLGADLGVQILPNVTGDDAGFNLAPAAPLVIPAFSTPAQSIDLARTSHHPANIRAVKVAITVRAPRPDLGLTGLENSTVHAALNRPDMAGEASYRRMLFESTAYTRNLETAQPVFPTYDPNYTAASCCPPGGTCAGNCGGG